jgi:hypothetical protein
MTCPFKRCQDQTTHCDGACHGLAPDGTPLTEIPVMTVNILKADEPNGNGRIYPLEALQRCVEKSQAGPVLGALGCPEGTTVDLNTLSHTVHNLRIQDGYLVGDVQVIKTPYGSMLSNPEVFNNVDFRPRGIGAIENGVVTNYQLISIDAVYDGAKL